MAAFKFALLFALAFFACQGEAKQVHPLVQQDPKVFDIVGIIQKVIQIVEIVVAQVNEGVDEVDPVVQELVALLPPNAGADVSSLITSIRGILSDLDTEIKRVIQVINDAVDQINNIKTCTDPQSDAFKEILDRTLEAVDQVIRDVLAANADAINDGISGLNSDIADLQNLFNSNIAAGLDCLAPGNADSCTCLSTVKDNIVNGVIALGANVVLHLTADIDLLTNAILPQVIDGITDPINQGLADTQPLVDNVCTCVANLS